MIEVKSFFVNSRYRKSEKINVLRDKYLGPSTLITLTLQLTQVGAGRAMVIKLRKTKLVTVASMLTTTNA